MKIGTDGVLLGSWAGAAGAKRALDVGTGTGLIALMLAQRFPELQVTAIEPNSAAFHEALENFRRSPWEDRLSCKKIRLQDFENEVKYDLIVSNPPFYAAETFSADPGRSQARHSSHLPVPDFLRGVNRLLSEDGRFQVILPEQSAISFILQAGTFNLFLQKQVLISPLTGTPPNRRMLSLGRNRSQTSQRELSIRDPNGYSVEYRNLTRGFYTMF